MIVTPSILTSSDTDLLTQITRLLPYFRHFQIDIADGRFVDTATVSISDALAILKKQPLPADVRLDFHLMVIDWETSLAQITSSSVTGQTDIVLVHCGVKPDPRKILQAGEKLSIGLVLSPEDSVRDCAASYPLSSLGGIQVMSVVPGKQGNPFIPLTLDKIEQLRNYNYRNKIYLDGGINANTLPVICSKRYKPDVIGPGSYLSTAPDITARVQELLALIAHVE